MQSKGLNLRASKRQREQVFPPRAYKYIFYNGVCLVKLSKRPLPPKPVPSSKLLPPQKLSVRHDSSKSSSTHPSSGTVLKNKLPSKNRSRPICPRLKLLNQYLVSITKKYATRPSDIPMPDGWGNPEYHQG